ncbi:MAG: glycosyltransferase [Planctomycetaceae bacterium]
MNHSNRTRLQVLVISTYFAPDVCGIAPIVGDLCEGLTQNGHSVTVLTSFPHYPEWKNKEQCRPWSKRTEVQPDGTEVVRHGAFIPKQPSGISGRLCYEFSMFLSLLRSLRTRGRRFDVMYVVCPSIGNVLFARMRAWFSGEPVVVCIQDIPADAASTTGLAGNWLGKLATIVQRWMLSPAETLTTISPVMADRIRETVRPQQPILLTPNWLVGNIAAAVERSREAHSESGCPKTRVLFYSGNIGSKQGLAAFCRTLQQLDLPFQMTIHGDGAAAPELHDHLDRSGDPRFKHGPLLSAEAFVERLKRTDWFVITEKSGMGTAVMPSKLIPAVTLGVPILAVCDPAGALGQAVSRHQLGICLAWNELNTLQERLTSTSDEQMEAYRQRCRRFSCTYDRGDRIAAIERILEVAAAARQVPVGIPETGAANG